MQDDLTFQLTAYRVLNRWTQLKKDKNNKRLKNILAYFGCFILRGSLELPSG